jgi:hypothetical protein
VDSTPTGVGRQNLRSGRTVLGREEVAGRDDLAHGSGGLEVCANALKHVLTLQTLKNIKLKNNFLLV